MLSSSRCLSPSVNLCQLAPHNTFWSLCTLKNNDLLYARVQLTFSLCVCVAMRKSGAENVSEVMNVHFPSTNHECICNGIYDLTVREYNKVESNILPSHMEILPCGHQESDKIMQPSTTLCEATGANVVALAGYKALLMELHSRTLLRILFGHQSSVTSSLKDSEHVLCLCSAMVFWQWCCWCMFYYSCLDDEVLIAAGGTCYEWSGPVLAKQLNTRLSDYVWEPGWYIATWVAIKVVSAFNQRNWFPVVEHLSVHFRNLSRTVQMSTNALLEEMPPSYLPRQ